jgi:large subunit ribosomal protein L18
MAINNRLKARSKRVRLNLRAVSSRPRLSVFRSNTHIWASLIDDAKQRTLCSIGDQNLKGTKIEKATQVGELIAKLGKKLKTTQVAFDRSGYRYHGRVKALAESARTHGLDF